ncbi:MAG: glycosyltransferase family 2 protein [Planctomycetota bacterium]
MDISIAIPTYKSAGWLSQLVDALTETLDALDKSYEICLAEDGSPDNTWTVLRDLADQHPHVKAVSLMQNVGQARATLCALANTRGDVVVTMDDDLQHPPDQMLKLLEVLEQDREIDAAFGYFPQKEHKAYRNLGSRLIWWINRRSLGLSPDAHASSFCAMRRPVVDAVISHETRTPTLAFLVYSSTHRVAHVPVEHSPRYGGESTYTLARQLRLAADVVCNVTMLPLRLVSILGGLACLFSVAYVIYALIRYFTGTIGVPGWTTLVILVSFFAGVTLLSIGILGEYLARVFWEVRRPPLYIEREKAGFGRDATTSQ